MLQAQPLAGHKRIDLPTVRPPSVAIRSRWPKPGGRQPITGGGTQLQAKLQADSPGERRQSRPRGLGSHRTVKSLLPPGGKGVPRLGRDKVSLSHPKLGRALAPGGTPPGDPPLPSGGREPPAAPRGRVGPPASPRGEGHPWGGRLLLSTSDSLSSWKGGTKYMFPAPPRLHGSIVPGTVPHSGGPMGFSSLWRSEPSVRSCLGSQV